MLPKRLINLIGTLLALGMFAAGIFMVAGPVALGSLEVEAQRVTVAQSNSMLAAQIEGLAKQAAELPALESELSGLRRGIPMSAGMDQVSALAVKAAAAADVELKSFDIGDTAAFVPPAGALVDGAAAEPAPPVAGDAAADEPRRQVSVSIVVETDSASEAADFVDRLRKGPRLLQILQVVNAGGEDGESGTTTVTALAFVQHP